MKFVDNVVLAFRAVAKNPVRGFGAVGGIATVLVFPIVVASLSRQLVASFATDPSQLGLPTMALAISAQPRHGPIPGRPEAEATVNCLDMDEVRSVDGVEGVYDFTRLTLTSVQAAGRRISPVTPLPEPLFAQLATESFGDGEMPVILGRFGVWYQRGRPDLEVEELVGSRTTITCGNLRRELDVLFPNLHVSETEEGYEKALRMVGEMIDLTQIEESLTKEARIVGVVRGPESFIRGSDAQLIRQWKRDKHSLEAVGFPSSERTQRILVLASSEASAKDLSVSYMDQCQVDSFYATLHQRSQELAVLVQAVVWLGGLCLLAVTLGIALAVWRVVRDSNHEIGILRAMGIGDRELGRLIATEAAILGLLGTTIAIVLGNLVGWFINLQILRYLQAQTSGMTVLGKHIYLSQIDLMPDSLYTWEPTQLWLIAVVVALAVLAAVPAARCAAKLDPVAAMRTVE